MIKYLVRFLILCISSVPVAAQDIVALKGGRIIDGNGDVPIIDGVVIIKADRVIAAGPEQDTPIPDGARIIDTNGMTVIVAATRTNTVVMQQQKTIGTLEAGKFADIIVIDGDPLANLADMRRVKHVIKGGEFFR